MFAHLQQVALLLAAQQGDAPAPGGGCAENPIILPVIMVAILYLVWYRPATQERKKQAAMLESLKRGDEVITASGIIGTISDMSERIITLEVAKNVKIKVLRSAIAKSTDELKAKEAEGSDKDAEKASK